MCPLRAPLSARGLGVWGGGGGGDLGAGAADALGAGEVDEVQGAGADELVLLHGPHLHEDAQREDGVAPAPHPPDPQCPSRSCRD